MVTDVLKDGNGKGSGFSRARLRLCNHIVSFDNRDDCTLLESSWSLETRDKELIRSVAL